MSAEQEPTRQRREDQEEEQIPSEETPLIPHVDGAEQGAEDQHPSKGRRRWPSLLALLILCIVAILIIVFAFVAPSAVEQYANQAVIFEPTSLSIDSFTTSGVRARVKGDFTLDPSRVRQKAVRDIGKFCTWIARAAESGKSDVKVSLPEYGNVVLGTAHVPPVIIDIRPGHTTHVDILADLEPGDVDGIRRIANDWVDGRLGQLRIVGKADVPIKSGIFSFGTQTVLQELLFKNDDIPSIPAYDIKKLNIHEVDTPKGQGMEADVSLVVQNDYPVEFTVPELGFEILVDGCQKDDPFINVAHAITDKIHIKPKQDVEVGVTGYVLKLPPILTQDCPDSEKSPLDILLGRYIHGEDNTVYVQGADAPSKDTPEWISNLISDIIVPIPVPGRTFGHLMKNFSLTDTHFSLPDPFADPDTPAANPRISAKVRAFVALPEEMNFNLSVARVRADADVFYKGKKLGVLDLHKWQQARSTRVDPDTEDEGPLLIVESVVQDAPLQITDEDVFADVVERLVFGGDGVTLRIKAEVDVGVDTALGEFDIRKIPAEGQVPIQPISKAPPHDGKPNLPSGLSPKLADLRIVDSTPTSLLLSALVNITNPTNYSASIPYVNVHILKNSSIIGNATAQDLEIGTGRNANLNVSALYDPVSLGGEKSRRIGRELLSQYISGWNTTFTLRTHVDSFPGLPWLGRALSRFDIELPAPPLLPPPSSGGDGDDDGDDDRGGRGGVRFIHDATFHLFSSTATFRLLSPLSHSTLYITSINATALYHGDEVGGIWYDLPFGVPPARLTPDGEGYLTPKLPVDWDLGSVGYEAVRKALGGTLRLAAKADVGLRLGRWEEMVWFQGKGIGAKVRL